MFHTAYMRATTVLIKINFFLEFNFLNFLKTPNLFLQVVTPIWYTITDTVCDFLFLCVILFVPVTQ